MLLKTEGLVIRNVNYSDTSTISTIYTRNLGVQTYMLKGIRNPKGRLKINVMQPMFFVDLIVSKRENKNLQSLREIKPLFIYKNVTNDIRRTAIGTLMLEIIGVSVKQEEGDEALFDFVKEQFKYLDQAKRVPAFFHLYFMLKLSGFLGFQPLNNYSTDQNSFNLMEGVFDSVMNEYSLIPELSTQISDLLNAELTDLSEIQINKEDRNALLLALERFYKIHLNEFKSFKTPQVYEDVFG